MEHILLNKDNCIRQITEFGFFAEQIPPCFSSKQLAENLPLVLPLISIARRQAGYSQKNQTAPSTLSTYKNDVSRRVLSASNPESFLRIAKLYADNWDKIIRFSKSPNSLSPITYVVNNYDETNAEAINSENFREANKSKSDFINGIKECIQIALGCQYRLKVDIANCYNSIYTHSITWAICEKDKAKKYLREKKPEELKSDYELGDSIDAFTRFQKCNETNGILVGPFTSRIFSEIVLASLDGQLRNSGFKFKRYVDDYKFYFRSETQAQEGIRIIEKILNQYNFNLNLSKTEILKFPYEQISNMPNAYKDALHHGGIFGVLNTASQFHLSGEKGAYKYALKFIRNRGLNADDFNEIFPLLINIMLLDPKYGKYVIEFLKENISKIDCSRLSSIINDELSYSLAQDLQQESLMFLYMIHDLNLELTGANMIAALHASDDFSLIIALDIWRHNNPQVKRSKTEAADINKLITAISEDLEKESFQGSRWLLLYEATIHKLFPDKLNLSCEISEFWKLLFDHNISFYTG